MNPVTNNLFGVFCVGLLTLGGLASAPVAWAVDLCCSITSINANGRVTARELSGKRVFQFQVTDKTILQGLRVGQQVHADFVSMKVSVQPDGATPCCEIVQAAGTAAIPAGKMPNVMAGDPCCQITSIAQNGRVTASEIASKRVFQFQVNDKALLATLRPGQRIHADFTAMKVSVQPDGATPCCQIVQAAGAAPVKSGQTISGQGKGDPIPTESVRPRPAIPAGEMPTVMAGAPCCQIVSNPALKGRMGRLVVAYPQGAKPSQARLYVYDAGDKEIARSDGNYTTELLPGTYAVMISGVRVKGVTIRSGHDTQVKVGVLRLGVGGTTRVSVYDTTRKLELTRSDGKQDIGFPIGTVQVNLAGQFSAATIQEGKITDF